MSYKVVLEFTEPRRTLAFELNDKGKAIDLALGFYKVFSQLYTLRASDDLTGKLKRGFVHAWQSEEIQCLIYNLTINPQLK